MARKTTTKGGKQPKTRHANKEPSPEKMTKAALAAEVKDLRARLAASQGADPSTAAPSSAPNIYDILESSPIGSTVVLDDGSFEFVNSRMAEMVGMTREQLMAAHARDLYVDPRERDAIGARLRKEGRLRDVEALMKTADGRPFWILLSFEKIEGETGGRYYGWVYDIDDQKTVAEELRQANADNALIRQIAEAANAAGTVEDAIKAGLDAISTHAGWLIGHAFTVLANGALQSMNVWHLERPRRYRSFKKASEGGPFEAATGICGQAIDKREPVWSRDIGADPSCSRSALAAEIGIKAGLAFPVVIGGDAVAALEFYAEETAEPEARLLALTAQISGLLGRVIDRKRAEAELSRQSDIIDTTLQAMNQGIVMVDADRKVLAHNHHFMAMFGLDEGRFGVGSDFRDIVSAWFKGTDFPKSLLDRALENLSRREHFDVILLDLMMPDLNGFEVLARLKADGRTENIPVIMISAFDEETKVIQCIEIGAEDYLSKPFNAVLLRARIESCIVRKRAQDRANLYLAQLGREKKNSEDLLLNILPPTIVERITAGEDLIADRFDNVTVLFADLVGFTEISSQLRAGELVHDLNRLFSRFDVMAKDFGVEKVKTIGDAYMVVAGLPEPAPDPMAACADMALGMTTALDEINPSLSKPFQIRIGLHTGPVVAGVIGKHKGTSKNAFARSRWHCCCIPAS